MKKTYVLDTNILVQSPAACTCFEDNDVVLPLAVLEELDGLRRAEGDRGTSAREAIRGLEALRRAGDLLAGVPLPGGGTLRVERDADGGGTQTERRDERVLQACLACRERGQPVVLVTKDIVRRVKAEALGVSAEDFTTEQVSRAQAQYTGRSECFVPEDRFKEFKKHGIGRDEVYCLDGRDEPALPALTENEFVVLRADQSTQKTHLGRVEGDRIVPLTYLKGRPYGVTPRSAGQYFLQEALMQPARRAPLVIVKGVAGTAKTFYSLAVGLEKLLEHPTGEYRKVLVTRPNAQFDSEIGFLPGGEQEKISPLMRPVIDNLEQLLDSDEAERYRDEVQLKDRIEEIFQRGIIQTEAMNFIRGRSFVNTYLIVDEAQNLTPKQIKGIITRAGAGTKIVLLGDPEQIDCSFLDERTNGLSYAAARMKGSPLCWQLTMDPGECERSALAMDAAARL